VQNGGESDIDCGAVCGPSGLCQQLFFCRTSADCQSQMCLPNRVCE
jgi:hypothetical protein